MNELFNRLPTTTVLMKKILVRKNSIRYWSRGEKIAVVVQSVIYIMEKCRAVIVCCPQIIDIYTSDLCNNLFKRRSFSSSHMVYTKFYPILQSFIEITHSNKLDMTKIKQSVAVVSISSNPFYILLYCYVQKIDNMLVQLLSLHSKL